MQDANSMGGKTKIALVGPNFFSYIQAIRDELIKRGYPCVYFDERHSNSITAKIAYRLNISSLVRRRRDQRLEKMLSDIVQFGATDVYLISVEVITGRFCRIIAFTWYSRSFVHVG